jgi:hypothetical protein
MKRFLITALGALAYSLVFASVAWAQEGGNGGSVGADVAAVLAPILAAATATERIIEMIFNWYESLILSANRLLGEGRGYLGWTQKQVQKYQVELLKLSNQNDPNALKRAEYQLALAQERLHDYLKSPFYISWKRGSTLILGIVFGVIIAFVVQLQMFKLLLGIEMPQIFSWLDTLVTGLIIGTGSAPVHSLIGLLQNTKDAVYEARTLWKGKSQQTIMEQITADLRNLRAEGAEFSAQAVDEGEGMSKIEVRRYVQHMLR